jgi:hypothetical protein
MATWRSGDEIAQELRQQRQAAQLETNFVGQYNQSQEMMQ